MGGARELRPSPPPSLILQKCVILFVIAKLASLLVDINTPFHKFSLNMRLLLQFPVDPSALLTVNLFLKMSKD